MKILFLAHRIPYPPDKGDKIRSYQVFKHLAARHEVHLACLIDSKRDLRAAQEFRGALSNLIYEELQPLPQRARMIKSLFNRKPLTVSYFYLPRLQARLEALAARENFDALFVYSSTMAEYVRDLKIPKRIMDFCDLDSQKFKQYVDVSTQPLSWLYRFEGGRLAEYEREVAQYFDHVLFIGPAEQRLFEANGGGRNTALMSNGVDFSRYYGEELPPMPSENSLLDGGVVRNDDVACNTSSNLSFSRNLFTHWEETHARESNASAEKVPFWMTASGGAQNTPLAPLKGGITVRPYLAFTGAMDYLPNVDAAHWCAREIFPKLKAILPKLEFYIIGGNPARKIRKLHDPASGIFVTGYLPDLRPRLTGARVFVAPMRIARGMQTKILEAIACGVPVVTSANAASGIGARAEEEVFIADTASEYARQTLRLLLNPEEHARLRRQAFAFLRANFDWDKNLAVLDQLLFHNSPLEGGQGDVVRSDDTARNTLSSMSFSRNLFTRWEENQAQESVASVEKVPFWMTGTGSEENTPIKEEALSATSMTQLSSRELKIKITHVVGRLSLGGLELEVIKLLNRLEQSRYESTIIATESIAPTAREIVSPHIKLVALNKGEGMQWQVITQIAEFCRRERIDILHSHNWTTMLYSVLAGKRAGVPIIIHGEHGRETHDYTPNWKQRLACRFLAAQCEVITTVSDDLVPLLTSAWHVPARKMVKMPIGIALHEFDFHADRSIAKRKLGVPENAFVLGTVVGNFRPVKDMPTMFRAFRILQQKVPRTMLVVVGGGNQQSAEQQAAEAGITSGIKFLGERRDIAAVLAAFEVYVNSSLYEGMSNAILEAMAAGAPVVATEVGGTPSIIHHEKTGLLTPPRAPELFAEAIQRLFEDRTLCNNVKRTARAYVEQHHSHDHYVQRHERIYEQCYSSKRTIGYTRTTSPVIQKETF